MCCAGVCVWSVPTPVVTVGWLCRVLLCSATAEDDGGVDEDEEMYAYGLGEAKDSEASGEGNRSASPIHTTVRDSALGSGWRATAGAALSTEHWLSCALWIGCVVARRLTQWLGRRSWSGCATG